MSRLPAAVRESVESATDALGLGRRVVEVTPVTGGCINHGARVRLDSDVQLFLKWNAAAPPGMFAAEAEGLTALRHAVAEGGAECRVPEPLARGTSAAGSWLAMEYIAPGHGDAEADRRVGRALALLHEVEVGATFGWSEDNWIGSLAQHNDELASWPAFWRDRRIRPQLDRARRRGLCGAAIFDRLVDRIPEAVGDPSITPSLLHGDLWSGNAFHDTAGRPVLIDPAVYRGHGEVDLAMTELFGGFGRGFRDAYHEVRPIDPAYRSHRRELYQLYYLLVHVNLFGGSYVAGSEAAASKVVAALG